MKDREEPTRDAAAEKFSDDAARPQPSFLRQYWDFLRFDRRWWMTPIVVLLLIAGAFLVLGGTVAAPFIYALF